MTKFKEFIKQYFIDLGIEEDEIEDNAYIHGDILDSLEMVDFILEIKKNYNIDLEISEDMTLGELYKLIQKNKIA
ncbi:hypothetical protein BX659_12716 [Orenia metallireducens]|jgi:acyl carrier protein|uniref:Acyl carrier protein n=1 Tax=Orenia metallireducens TaxID=1413210 RepID=A0A285I3B2_9FIRM|nr:hypothetical protein [Orenia metallireducens]PRX23124.1 hypothetical protein BX659_12716 [Orenia metallireducens]SNY42450.1 hypothetical protein SAMN06265827_13016 [Orenia metallireducens]